MNPLILLLVVLAIVPALRSQAPAPVMLPEPTTEGSVSVSPATGISGELGTWTVTYRVGPGGIATGGGIRVQLPDTWHSGVRNSAIRVQATDPKADHYVASRTSNASVQLKTIVEDERAEVLIKHSKPSLDGRSGRYVFVARASVTAGALRAGDEIAVVYGERGGGSAGYLAASIATGPEPVLVAVDADGSGRFRLHRSAAGSAPTIQARPGRPIEAVLVIGSNGAIGRPLRANLAILDKQFNGVERPLEARIRVIEGDAQVPANVRTRDGRGTVEFSITPRKPGVLRLQAEVAGAGLAAESNPCEVFATLPDKQLYWGDLHSHSTYSWDGVGQEPFAYARDVSALDFFALTDHSSAASRGIRSSLHRGEWEAYGALTDRHYEPGRFVTFHAYECSFGTPWGHHNVFFRDRPGPLHYPAELPLPELWKLLEAGNALTIPHHTGKMPARVRFDPQDDERRRNFEIYSGHGLSEAHDPAHPLAFEQSDFTSPATSLKDPSFAQDAWRKGLRFSTIAASDDHRSQPGQPHFGLAAIRATSLNRHDVFQGLYDRDTYGTTGARIILHFDVDGVPMGHEARPSAPPLLRVRAHGTGAIERVEILKSQPAGAFAVIKSWTPGGKDFAAEHRDAAFQPGAVYYVRLRQAEKIRGRVAMAWSSPVWTAK